MLMTGLDYRESLRSRKPRVYIDGRQVESIVDEPAVQPGLNAIAVTYDYAHDDQASRLLRATQVSSGQTVNRMLHINESPDDLLTKLEAVRLVCKASGCAQRYLSHDALNAIHQATHRIDEDKDTDYHQRFLPYLHRVQELDLTLGVAMTDAKGDRSLRPHAQPVTDTYVHITERRPEGIVIRGTKAIVTGAPYVHEFLVMPGRNMTERDADFAVCCAVPLDAPGVTVIARPAGRPGEKSAHFSGRYGQSVGVVVFEDVFVPHERVFLAGEWEHSGFLTGAYATHHRHSCIGARAGFGDLLIGAGVHMIEANGLEPSSGHLRDSMVELIKIVEGFYACGVAASVYGFEDPAGNYQPDTVFSNIGKLLLGYQIYDMHRIAHQVSGGLVVALPGPDEDHNPVSRATLGEVLRGRADIPAERRVQLGRLLEDLTASYTGGWYSVISLHGGGSPEAMKREIYRHYPLEERRDLVTQLLERGVYKPAVVNPGRQPGRCCAAGCNAPEPGESKG